MKTSYPIPSKLAQNNRSMARQVDLGVLLRKIEIKCYNEYTHKKQHDGEPTILGPIWPNQAEYTDCSIIKMYYFIKRKQFCL